MRVRTVITAAAMALILGACLAPPVPAGPQNACTAIGCESQLAFDLGADLQPGGTYELEACIDGDCATATVPIPPPVDGGGSFGVGGPFTLDAGNDIVTVRLVGEDYSGAHEVSLTLAGTDGLMIDVEATTEFERGQPNGPGCEPICWQATVRV